MKKSILFSVAFLLIWGTVQGQTVHSVDTSPNALYNSVLSAADGDILELTESGVYRIDSLIHINKKLTIRAKESLTTRPVIRNYYPYTNARFIFEIVTGGYLTLEGLELDGMSGSVYSAENLIQTSKEIVGSYSLFVDNCYLRDVDQGEKGSFFRSYSDTYADTIKFTNSVLYNCGKIGIRINESDNDVDYFEFSNSSMFNVWAEGIYVQGSDVKFRVDHCTFNNVGYGSADILRPRFILDAEILNSIFSNVPEPRTRAMLLYGSSTVDYCNFYNVGRIDIHSSEDFNWGDSVIYNVDPQYFNAAWGDFYLTESSPLLSAANDGSMLGDPNWPNNRPFIPAVLEVGSANNALYDSLQSARSGDILELIDSGEYPLDSILYIEKEITIRAAADLESKPVLKNVNAEISTRSLIQIETGGNLTLQGLDLNGLAGSETPAKYLIRTASSITGSYSLKLDDCILRDVVSGSDGNFFRAYSDTYADSVIFTNCILANSGREGIRIKDAVNTVKYFEISNSTMYNTSREGIYVQGNEVEFIVDHCTFNNLGYDGYKFVRPRDILDADIKNSIFSHRTSTSSTMQVYGGEVDYCDFFNVGSVSFDAGVSVGENILDVDPQYADTANFDFTLLETSPLYFVAEGNSAMGDPRWAVNPPILDYAIIPVDLDRNALYDSIMIANDGDIIELISSGDYLLDSLINIDKDITIRAAAGLDTKPVIKFVNPDISTIHIFQIVTGGKLRLSGLELDGLSNSETPAKYLLRTDESIEGSYSLIVEDCILHDVDMGDGNGNFFRAYSDTYADTVIFDNCILYNSGREGIRIKDSDNTVKYFQLSNSTMYNTSTEGVYVQGSNVVARIDHCTFNNLGYSRNEYTRLRYVVDAEITNCIYSNGVVPPSRCMLFYGSLLSNCNFYEVGSVSMSNSEYTTQESIWKDYDPVYEDADNGNFTLLESSPMYFKATDGEALGDLRWAKNEPETPYYTVSIKVLSEIDSISIEGATVVFNNETMITDASGTAVFDSISPITNAAYVVTADNFQDASGSITVTNDNITETALMSPEAYTVTFIVSGNDGFIEGALVVFNNAIILTDVEGKAVFDSIAPISDAMYLVTAENYQNASGSITVNDADVTETVLLTSLFSSQFENWNEEVIIYPNPASEYIKLRLPDGFIGTVEFIDITGRIMEILDVSNEKNILFNTEAFNEGIYYVKVSSENTTITKRFIISK